MDHGKLDSPECPTVTPHKSNHYSSLPASSGTPTSEQPPPYPQAISPTSYQIAVHLLNSIADFEAEGVLPTNTEDFCSNSSNRATVDLSTLTRRLITLASSVSARGATQTSSSLNDTLGPFECASGNSSDNAGSSSRSELQPTVNFQSSVTKDVSESNFITPWLAAASPSIVTVIRNALAQLALLGLSHSSDTGGNGIDLMRITNGSTTDRPPDTLCSVNGETLHTEVKSPIAAQLSPPAPQEPGAKVIIRQTADADEHFFKALRGLKVDISNGATTMAAKPLTSASQWVFGAKSESSRAAAELAVEEHFEKSLAAFPGFASRRELIPNGGTCRSELSSVCSLAEEIAGYKISRGYPCAHSVIKGSREDDDATTKQQPLQDSPLRTCSPETRSYTSDVPKPPPYYSRQHSLHYLQLCASANWAPSQAIQSPYAEAAEGAEIMRHIVSAVSNHELPENTSSPSIPVSSSGMAVHNTFKPKKNWMVQYGEKVDRYDSVFVRPTGTNVFGIDLSSSSHTFPVQPPRLIVHDELGLSGSRSLSGQFTSVETAQCEGDRQHLMNERREATTLALNHRSVSGESDGFSGVPDCASQQQTSYLEKLKITNIQEQPGVYGWRQLPKNLMENKAAISQELVDIGNKLIPNQSVTTSASLAEDCTASTSNDDHSVNKTIGTNFVSTTEAECPAVFHRSDCQVPSSRLNWALSSSSSSPPTPGEISSNSAITPVSGVTSEFFSGSTYSLDSSLSHTQSLAFETRESDSGIDAKSISSATDEQVFYDSKLHTLTESSGNLDGSEQANYFCSMRKRASSEASPWSTLKRSRSVLTSPVSRGDTFRVCSPGANEHMHPTDNDSMPASKRFAVLGEFACRSVDGTGRPLTSDTINLLTTKSALPPCRTPDRFLDNSASLSNTDSCSSFSLPLHPHSCGQKLNTKSTTLCNQPGVTTTDRCV